MLDSLLDQLNGWLDEAAAFLWRQFEADLALTEAILARTEALWQRVELFFSNRTSNR